jgi:hypothetical protein
MRDPTGADVSMFSGRVCGVDEARFPRVTVTNGYNGEYKEPQQSNSNNNSMATTATFERGEGIVGPLPMSLAIFLRNYAREKGVKIWPASQLATLEDMGAGDTICGIEFDGTDGLITAPYPKVVLTVQEFLAKCDAQGQERPEVPQLNHIRIIELGDYDNVELNGEAGIMRMNEEDISFADIRRVRELAQDSVDTAYIFQSGDGVCFDETDDKSEQDLLKYLVRYAQEHGVPMSSASMGWNTCRTTRTVRTVMCTVCTIRYLILLLRQRNLCRSAKRIGLWRNMPSRLVKTTMYFWTFMSGWCVLDVSPFLSLL